VPAKKTILTDSDRAKRAPRRKPDDKAQFERFVETARKLGVEEVGPEFDDTVRKIVRVPISTKAKS